MDRQIDALIDNPKDIEKHRLNSVLLFLKQDDLLRATPEPEELGLRLQLDFMFTIWWAGRGFRGDLGHFSCVGSTP